MSQQEAYVRLFDHWNGPTPSPFFIDALVELMRLVEADRGHGRHAKGRNSEQKFGLHLPRGPIRGNLARLRYDLPGVGIFGEGWIGASAKARRERFAMPKLRDGAVLLRATGINTVACTSAGGTAQFAASFTTHDRMDDSEYLLINYLSHLLGNLGFIPHGELVLVTERIPCAHCFRVIQAFAAVHPAIQCGIAYLYETRGRSPASLLAPEVPGNVSLYKVSLNAGGVDAVRIRPETPDHFIAPRVLEQMEAADMSAHVSARAPAALTLSGPRRRRDGQD